MTEEEVRDKIRALVARVGGVRALARKLGVSPSLVSFIVVGRQHPSGALLKAVGVKKVVKYEAIDKGVSVG